MDLSSSSLRPRASVYLYIFSLLLLYCALDLEARYTKKKETSLSDWNKLLNSAAPASRSSICERIISGANGSDQCAKVIPVRQGLVVFDQSTMAVLERLSARNVPHGNSKSYPRPSSGRESRATTTLSRCEFLWCWITSRDTSEISVKDHVRETAWPWHRSKNRATIEINPRDILRISKNRLKFFVKILWVFSFREKSRISQFLQIND